MYNWDNYDNDIAYGYDDYVEPKEEIDEDYLIDKEIEERLFENYEYESKMAEQMLDSLYNQEK